MMYGLGMLAFSFLLGQFLGETLGVWLGVEANIGGVGFAMLLLILAKDFLEKTRRWTAIGPAASSSGTSSMCRW